MTPGFYAQREPESVEALVATVREALEYAAAHEAYNVIETPISDEARAALDALASELERLREEIEGLRFGYRDSQARLDRAVEALREIAGYFAHCRRADGDSVCAARARSALAEIESEPYADIPGAGQRGCG